LVDEEVAALDRVVGVVLPGVRLEVRQGRGDPALRGAGVGPGGIELADDRRAGALARLQRGHQAGAAGPDDDAVELVVVHLSSRGRAAAHRGTAGATATFGAATGGCSRRYSWSGSNMRIA